MAAEADLYVVVSVAGESLGLRASAVLKVIEVGAVARLPRLPGPVVGVTPYRGRIVTVVDLALLLDRDRPVADQGGERRIVVLDSGSRNVGVLVERVEVISTMSRVEAHRGREHALIAAQAICGERAVGLIDPERLSKRIAGLCDPASA